MTFPYRKHVLVCIGKRCNDEKNGDDRGECLRAELKELNKKMGRKETVRVCGVTCLDLCDDGPNMVVWPDGEWHSHVDRKRAVEIYLDATKEVDELNS